MSELTVDIAQMITILQKVASDLKSHAEELRQLDAKLGDGDLGVTIELSSQAISEYLKSSIETDIGKLLVQCGMNINRVSPSTFGTIMSSAFMGGGRVMMGKSKMSIEDLVLIGEAAVENIKKRGKAEVGDKTVIDTLIPALETLKIEIARGTDTQAALEASIKAARDGMEATIDMKAKFGRAQWFHEGSIGVQDGGATAMYYMMKSFTENLILHKI